MPLYQPIPLKKKKLSQIPLHHKHMTVPYWAPTFSATSLALCNIRQLSFLVTNCSGRLGNNNIHSAANIVSYIF
jgi:hypothetical protein